MGNPNETLEGSIVTGLSQTRSQLWQLEFQIAKQMAQDLVGVAGGKLPGNELTQLTTQKLQLMEQLTILKNLLETVQSTPSPPQVSVVGNPTMQFPPLTVSDVTITDQSISFVTSGGESITLLNDEVITGSPPNPIPDAGLPSAWIYYMYPQVYGPAPAGSANPPPTSPVNLTALPASAFDVRPPSTGTSGTGGGGTSGGGTSGGGTSGGGTDGGTGDTGGGDTDGGDTDGGDSGGADTGTN
jgi:hypothetical protein